MLNSTDNLRQYNFTVLDFALRIIDPVSDKVKKTLTIKNVCAKTMPSEKHDVSEFV